MDGRDILLRPGCSVAADAATLTTIASSDYEEKIVGRLEAEACDDDVILTEINFGCVRSRPPARGGSG